MVVVVQATDVLVVVVSVAAMEAANALVVHLGPVHPIVGHPSHPILYLILCPTHHQDALYLYLHLSLSISLVWVHLLDLSTDEGV